MEKDNWDKFEIVVKFIAAVSIPIVLSIYGNYINSAIKTKQLNQQNEQHKSVIAQKYIGIAVSILNTNPSL